jgi:signal transduction histidine kinase
MLETEGRRVEFIAPAEEQIERVELTPDLRRHLWLFFKEAVTNVARHSGATDVSVDFTLGPRQLRLAIRDNGCGFDPEATVSGQGLRSLRHRTAEMRGELRLDSAAGRGTEIELLVPLPA